MNKLKILLGLFLLITSVGTQAYGTELLQDELVNSTLIDKELPIPETNLKYNFEDTDIVLIKLKIDTPIKSENDIYEGQEINFKATSDAYYNGELIIKKGTLVPARIETIITPGMNGIPASIIIGNFKIENIKKSQITDSIELFGQDRSLWVFPLKWALTPLPPTGSLTNFIKGGHSKITEKRNIILEYHPNW